MRFPICLGHESDTIGGIGKDLSNDPWNNNWNGNISGCTTPTGNINMYIILELSGRDHKS